MLSFSNPLDALRCSIKMISDFDGSDKEFPFNSCIGINRCSCLAINSDSHLDYFGLCVNVASKILDFADPGEIYFTEDFAKDEAVTNFLKEKNYTFKNINRIEIENAGEIYFRKIKIKKAP